MENKLKSCPFCGHDEFYTNEYVYGTIRYAERFDGKEAENGELYDSLSCKTYSDKIYCRNCNKVLGRKESGELSKQVEKKLKEGENE